ncbi:hypothetical protein [Parasegetibacter sp. NRK P23]|uniref:hypothetical protein n=1 Tax=Parasegetibacter sp. NRK P23 TaxID=2942999 RepID=UPI002044ADF8|nr:hypothetical protein [Parasegetibacter sp. NRK P23]MCM5527008.1 hypothetical protein [Parasegetibacter sp. NRK P23]
MEKREEKKILVKCGNEYLTQEYLDAYDQELEEGNAQVERGEFVTHEEVLKQFSEWESRMRRKLSGQGRL